MQGYPVDADPAVAQSRFQRRRKMQSRGRGCNGAFINREHGLVVAGVALVGGAFSSDVRRQRRRAEIGDGLVQRRPVKRKRQRDLAVTALVLDLRVEMAEQAYPALIAEPDDVAPREFFGW